MESDAERAAAELRKLNAETVRLAAEARKLAPEASKLEAEATKLRAEAAKLQAEKRSFRQSAIADFAKLGLAFFAAGIAALKVFDSLGWL